MSLDLHMNDFTTSSKRLTLLYEEAIHANQGYEQCLKDLCELVCAYMPLINYQICVMNNVNIESSMNMFKIQLVEFYTNGWDDARLYHNIIFDADIEQMPFQPEHVYTPDCAKAA
jgi:hypothetical protein